MKRMILTMVSWAIAGAIIGAAIGFGGTHFVPDEFGRDFVPACIFVCGFLGAIFSIFIPQKR